MTTRQYIGARYVPKFYENPDTLDASWKSGVVYEPLTMVTYNSATYTSKKEVPQTVGNPAVNPLYWVATGNYNGQIAYLQQQIGTLADLDTIVKDSLVSAVNELVVDINIKTINNDTVEVQNGNYIYNNCTIVNEPTEIELTGKHIFNNCTINNLFIGYGEYYFYNCTYNTLTMVHAKGEVHGCAGGNIHFIGDCHNSVIEGNTIVATDSTHPAICFDGTVANNVKIINNDITSLVGSDTFNMQCINTHGVTNSIIKNNKCTRTLPDVPSDNAVAIDISGHAESAIIRAFNNVIEDNTSNGDIFLFACGDAKVVNNVVRRIIVGGSFQSLDYGEWLVEGNVMDAFKFDSQTGSPTALLIHIINNTMTRYGAIVGTPLTGSTVKVSQNTVKGALVNTATIMADIEAPEEFLMIADGEKEFVPNAYIVVSDFAAVPVGTIFNGGLVENSLGVEAYIIYKKLNILSGQSRVWCQ